MDKLTSKTISWLRFVLVMMVLLVHVHPDANPNFLGTDLGCLADGTPGQVAYTVGVLAMLVVCNLSVPLFFFISGYLFYTSPREWNWRGVWWGKMKRRVYTLLVPYLAYNLLSATNGYVMSAVDPSFVVAWDNPSALPFLGEFWNSTTACVGMTNILGFSMQLYYPADIPLWFVRDLIVVVLCTPLLHWLLKRFGRYFVVLLGLVWFAVPYLHLRTLGFESAFFFFSWGAYMSINRKDMLQVFGQYFKASVCLYLLLGIAHVAASHYWPEVQGSIKQLNVLVGLLFAYNFAAWLLKRGICKVNPFLASASFFVYVAHALVVPRVLKLLFITFSPASDWALLLVYTLAVVLTVALLLGTFYIMRRYTPGLLKVVAGRK